MLAERKAETRKASLCLAQGSSDIEKYYRRLLAKESSIKFVYDDSDYMTTSEDVMTCAQGWSAYAEQICGMNHATFKLYGKVTNNELLVKNITLYSILICLCLLLKCNNISTVTLLITINCIIF